MTSLVKGLPQIISTVVGAIPQIISGIVSAVGQGVSAMADAGANLVRGLWNGITSLAGWLWNQVSGWVSGIWDGITSFFGIHSPSRKMAWAGSMLVEGLAGAIRTDGKKATRAAKSLARDTLDAFDHLQAGITIPIETTTAMPVVDLQPVSSAHRNEPGENTSHGPVDVESVADTVARRILGSLDVKVVLNDGTLVGKLAPGLNAQLARINHRATVMAGGV